MSTIEISLEIILLLVAIVISLVGVIYGTLKYLINNNSREINQLRETRVSREEFKDYREAIKHDIHEFKVHITNAVDKVEYGLKEDISDVKNMIHKVYDLLIKDKA